ncbi:MAG: chitobiase/beta-hexosaminidase C-terminal domain-containing protein [Prevotella sp.]|nr:chitobiase/beta-hexosaminidase C-terminal domain-containing protein [Prevotella sp.]
MIKKLRYLFTLMLLLVASVGWAEEETLDFADQGYTNGQTVSEVAGTVIKATFTNGGTPTAYYDTGTAIRVYNGGTMSLTANGGKITKVVYTYELNGAATVTVAGNNVAGSYNSSDKTWTGEDTEVVLTAGTAKHVRISKVVVTYTPAASDQVAKPTFSPAAGEVVSGTEVTITAPGGCTVAYTIDGTTDPKEDLENAIRTDGNIATIEITEDVTIKAVSVDSEENTSDVVEATYTIKQETPQYETVSLPYEETFDSNIGKFVIEDTNLPGDLTYVWNHDSYGYMKASAFKSNTAYASESWLISPIIDLTENTGNADFSFDHATNYFTSVQTAAEEATVWVREESGEWSKLNNITYPESMGWTFVSSGTVDLSSYNGKKIQIGFKYISTSNKAGTWEVKNVIVGQVKADPELSFSESSYTATIGESNSFPELQNPNELAVTYRVSNSNVATIDETSGEITLVAAGQTTVYAEFAGNDEYKEGSASYMLVVKEKSIAGSDKFELVTDASTLSAGDIIILVGSDKGSYYALGTTQNNNNRAAEAVSIETDGTIIPGSTVQQITLEEGWYFNVGSGYLYAASSSSNHLKTEANADDNAKATIAIADEDATILFQGLNTRNLIRFNPNSGNPIFSCYASTSTTGTLPQIYRKVKDLAETVTISNAKYATYVAPFDCTIADGVTVYKVTAIGESNVTLEEVIDAIPEGAAVVVNGEAGTYDVTKAESASELTGNLLKAVTAEDGLEHSTGNYYVLANGAQGVGFYPVTSGTIAKGKGYLEVEAGAKFYGFGGDETGINDINVNVNANDAIYSISGQRLQKLQRGINIVNGKKIVVK